ncbi:MAG TPA: hypothetical protein VN253_05520 [Kofleriaceae bacterium]|nr:hypothetical protein [Kofleriaceae bacterium]
MRRNKEATSSERHRAIMREASARLPHRRVVDTDPEDPSQQLDDTGELDVEPLSVEARPSAEAIEDFDLASAENMERESEDEDEDETSVEAAAEPVHDTGDLYGVRTPHAGDTDLAAPEDQDSFEGSWRGQTWLESLEEHAAVMGPAPEEEIVIVDDSDLEHPDHRGHHPTEWRDRPVADKGSGGAGGL